MEPVISEESIANMSYRRSKWWSNFLDTVIQSADEVVYTVCDLDKVNYDVSDNEEAWDRDEEAEEDSDAEKDDLVQNSGIDQKENSCLDLAEVKSILNQTRPILEQHERKWKEEGLECILNTFDFERIETVVGGWIRRNHSIIDHKYEIDSDSDTDSMHSGETARYIRSTRKFCAKSRRSCITSIKRFRKRETLQKDIRNKYKIVSESTTYRKYDCRSCQRRSSRNPSEHRHQNDLSSTSSSYSTTDDESYQSSRRYTPLSENFRRRQQKLPNLSLCPAKDSDSTEAHSIIPCSALQPLTEQQSIEKCIDPLDGKRNLTLQSETEDRYATPLNATSSDVTLTKASPPERPNKRYAAKKALTPLIRKSDSTSDRGSSEAELKAAVNVSESSDDCTENDTSFEEKLRQAIANSKKTYQQEQKELGVERRASMDSIDSEIVTPPVTSTTRRSRTRKTFKVLEHLPDDSSENTFLKHFKNVCNSTALKGTIAAKKNLNFLPPIRENSVLQLDTTSQAESVAAKSVVGSVSEPPLTHRRSADNEIHSVFDNTYLSPTSLHGSERRKQLCRLENHKMTTPNKFGEAKKSNMIPIYTPKQKELAPNGYFQVTKEYLKSVIGEKEAAAFLKCNVGKLSFASTSTIYYCPPDEPLSSSDSSDDDWLELVSRVGELYECVQQDENEN